MKFQEWIKTHRHEAILAGAGILATIWFTSRSKSNSSTTGNGVSSFLNGSTAAGTYDALTGMGTVASGAPSASGWTIPAGITKNGSGWVVPGSSGATEFDTSGIAYDYISSTTQLQSLQSAGTQLFYQAQPGVFLPTTGSGLASGTPLFYKA